MIEKPMICEVCGRESVEGFYGSHGGGRCSAGANMGDEETCFRLGYERERAAREKAEAALRELVRAFDDGAMWRPGEETPAVTRARAMVEAM